MEYETIEKEGVIMNFIYFLIFIISVSLVMFCIWKLIAPAFNKKFNLTDSAGFKYLLYF